MTNLRNLQLIALLGGTLALQGCFNSDSSPSSASDDTTAEEEAIQSVIFDEEGDLTTTDVRFFDDGADGGAATAPINTANWRRELLSLDKTITIVIDRPDGEVPTANVSIMAVATGLLHLLVNDQDTSTRLTKDFDDTGVRSLYFERSRPSDRNTDARHRGWRLVALSGVSIESTGTTREIRSVRVQAGDVDKTITNVTDLVRVDDITQIPPLTQVTLTVATGDATDHVFLHRRHARHRMKFVNNGDGTFTGMYETGHRSGARHVAIDVLSDGTLFDDQERYDNVVWGIPYRIVSSTGNSQ